MNTTPDTERRERYATAIRDRVRIRLGARILALAEQGRPLKMSFSEAEAAATAAMAVADFEIDAAKFQAGEQWAKEYAEAAEVRAAADRELTQVREELDDANGDIAKMQRDIARLRKEAAEVRGAAFDEAADAIDHETRLTKLAGVLEPDRFRPCRDASAQLRRMAAAARPDCDTDHGLSCDDLRTAARPDNTTGA